jgi:tetratricopeptide (TPR) repeat protein
MKNSLLALLGFLFVTSVAFAQEDGVKLAKAAGRSWATYNIDKASNIGKLIEAKQKIDQAMQTQEAQAVADAWINKGNIYRTIVSTDSTVFKLLAKDKPSIKGENDALVSFLAYKKAYEIATKKYEKEDAIKGIYEVQPYLINIGVEKFQKAGYEKAFLSFQAATQSHEMIKAHDKKMKSVMDSLPSFNDILYFAGKSAGLAKRYPDAISFLNRLVQSGTAKADIYESLYTAKLESGDADGANAILQDARKKFPDDTSLLFDDINAHLKAGKLTELIDKLKQAIKQEPKNVGLYVTLGNVYDNLYQAQIKEKNDSLATIHFNNAKEYYEKALGVDPKALDAVYSIGALYYNKAAFRTQEMNALPDNDYSPAGLKKLETYRKEIMGLFDQSLPYFQKAESMNPNDTNTLIALSEIYARKEDDLSLEFKKRLEKIKGGQKNTTSYFKN